MTAPTVLVSHDNSAAPSVPTGNAVVPCLHQLCHSAIEGRRAVRAMSPYLQRYRLAEPDLQVLWSLREDRPTGVDQTTLAGQLVYSPAQVSATVEKLRQRGLLSNHEAPGDRRRRLWKLSADGQSFVREMTRLVEEFVRGNGDTTVAESVSPRKAAA